jgi:hypothetical protein
MSEPSILDVRLAEIDRRLRTIQTDLVPAPVAAVTPEDVRDAELHPSGDRLPPPTPLRPAPAPSETPEDDARVEALLAQLRDLSAAHERLLDLHRELLSQYAAMLEREVGTTATAAVTAGPFADGAAVRAFEHALASLPGVDRVDVREYLGPDRVLLEARLAPGA